MNTPKAGEPIDTYLSLVYPSASSRVALCLIPPAGRPEHRFCTIDAIGKYLGYCRAMNAKGWGVYITPSVLRAGASNRRKDAFLEHQQIIYLDCDERECLEHIKERYPYPALVVKTSKGRYQAYWKLDKPVSIAEQEALMSALAIDTGADRAATDVSRVLRLPGFWNRKQGRKPNTVDIVFTREHTVSYKSLSGKLSGGAALFDTPSGQTSTRRSEKRVLDGSERRRGKREGEISASERDWYEVHYRLATGHQPQEVIDWLENHRRDKRNPRYYAEYTVRKAVAERQAQDLTM